MTGRGGVTDGWGVGFENFGGWGWNGIRLRGVGGWHVGLGLAWWVTGTRKRHRGARILALTFCEDFENARLL
jgi:hypothetical protein